MGMNLKDALLKGGLIAASVIDLVSEGLGFYSEAKTLSEAGDYQIKDPDSSYVQPAENPSSDLADILEAFDMMIPDEWNQI